MKWVAAAMILAAAVVSLVMYPQLPEVAPIHWNAAGEADGFAPRLVAAAVGPGLVLFAALLLLVLPGISPRGYAIDRDSRGYRAIASVILFTLLAMHTVAMLSGAGVPVKIETVIPFLVAALFIVIGRYMTAMQRNFFIGIRTPWTLADEDVWFRTHRLGSRLFMLGGLALALLPIIGVRRIEAAVLAITGIVAIIPIVYSYVIYRRSI